MIEAPLPPDYDAGVREVHVNTLISKVNNALKNDDFESARWGSGDTEGYWFTIPGYLRPSEKRYLTRAFQSSGWTVVGCWNSEENGERPGLCTLAILP